MILGDTQRSITTTDPRAAAPTGPRLDVPTLDDLFRAAASLHPDTLALVDPPDRGNWDSGAPRRLTYREADRIVSAIAGRLHELGLPTDSVVAFQLPNTVECVLTLLGIIRAGLIAAPMPPLWRKADSAATLAHVAPRALIASARAEEAMHIAAETFSVRFVCGFGHDLPDGLVPLDGVFTQAPGPCAPLQRRESPEDHVALVTFDVVPEGSVPIARSHRQLVEAAQYLAQVAGLRPSSRILMTLSLTSFSALATAVGGWLLSGGTLVLHQAFSPDVLRAQVEAEACDVAILPGPLASRIVDAGLFGEQSPRVIGLWRAPERLFQNGAPPSPAEMLDLMVFGEIACIPVQRQSEGGKAVPLTPGRITPGGEHAPSLEISRTTAGTLAFGGSLVPKHAFPPGSGRSDLAKLKISDLGLVDSEYPCRVDGEAHGLLVDAPPPGIIAVGGCRFRMRDLQDLADRLDNGAHFAALPDQLCGHRLAGVGASPADLRATLRALGVHPLLVAAFRDRRIDERVSAA